MKKCWSLIIFLVPLLFLVSCTTQDTNQNLGKVFQGGTQGLLASFEPIGPTEDTIYTVYDTESFPLEVKLQNKGEEKVLAGKATVTLIGPSPTDFENIPAWTINNKNEIDKITEFNPLGGEEVVSFTPTNDAKYKAKVTGYQDLNWNVEYAYNYKTHVIINDVCFKGDITDTKVCNIKEVKSFAVSGAPITVTSVEEDSAGQGLIQLKITLRNAGGGDATLPGTEFERYDQIAFVIDEPTKWECKSGGKENQGRMLEDNTAVIFCKLKQPLQKKDLYTKTLSFTVEYVYKQLIQEKLRVKESVK